MRYFSEILWYLVFPETIVVSYYVIIWMLKKLDVQDNDLEQE